MKILLYTAQITPRLSYIAHFIGEEILGQPLTLVSDLSTFQSSFYPKINYSSERISVNEIWLQPHGLLSSKEVTKVAVDCFHSNGQTAFFPTAGDYPFDILAACFYLLSRYEEYLPHTKDIYGRFAHENSLAFQQNFLQIPLINFWLKDFRLFLQSRYPAVHLVKKAFSFVPTYDIDEAFSYKGKGIVRTIGGISKALLQGKFSQIEMRLKVLIGQRKDPFDAFGWMNRIHEQLQLQPIYFFLVAGELSKYDRNILPRRKSMRNLIATHAERYTVAIHPSWQSGDKPHLITEEIKTLETLSSQQVVSSRQHFVRFTLPVTYRDLIAAGIREDYSMGYGTINGFRASTASPFFWFDLERNETTELKLFPFCFMDANSFFEEKLTPDQALEELKQYFVVVKSVDGCLITLWHNTFLGTDLFFIGWRECYATFLKQML